MVVEIDVEKESAQKEPLRWMDTLLLKKNEILITVGAILFASSAMIIWQTAKTDPARYMQADFAFLSWIKDESSLEKVWTALKKAPGMEQKFEASIAQKLLDQGCASEKITEKWIARLEREAPSHASFSKATVLIENKDYQAALERSVRLKELMKEEDFFQTPLKGGSVLYAYNLIRIAFLQQKLENRPGEKKAWEDVEEFLSNGRKTLLADLVIASFQEKGTSLSDYIADRKSTL